MKKFLLAMLGILAVAGAGLSEWSSIQAQNAYTAWVNALAARPEIALLDTKFESGWLVSRASTELEVRGDLGQLFQRSMEGAGQEEVRSRIGFHLEHRISHGLLPLWQWIRDGRKGLPILDRIDSRITFDQETLAELEPVVGHVPALMGETKVRLFGEAETALEFPDATLSWIPVKGGSRPLWTLHWRGLRGGLVLGSHGRTLAGQLTAPGFTFESDQRRVVAAGFDATLDWTRNAGGWWVGQTGLHVRELRSEHRGAHGGAVLSRIGLEDLAANGNSHVIGERFGVQFDGLAKRLLMGSHVGAPFHFLLALRGDDSATEPADGPEAPAVPEPASADSWRSVLAHHPVFDLSSFSIGTPGGAVEGQGHLMLAPSEAATPTPPAASPPTAPAPAPATPAGETPPPGARIAEAVLDARIPAALLDGALADLPKGGSAALLKQGLLMRQDDGSYRTRLELSPTGLTANGQAPDPATLAGIQQLADAFVKPAPAEAAASAPAPAPDGAAAAPASPAVPNAAPAAKPATASAAAAPGGTTPTPPAPPAQPAAPAPPAAPAQPTAPAP